MRDWKDTSKEVGYERIPLSVVTGLQSTLGPGEECDQSAGITSPTACAWRPTA